MSWNERVDRAAGVPIRTAREEPAAARLVALKTIVWSAGFAVDLTLCALTGPLERAGLPGFSGFLVAVIAAGTILSSFGRRSDAWLGTRWLGSGLLLVGTVMTATWVVGQSAGHAWDARAFDIGMVLVLTVALGVVLIECGDHVVRHGVEVGSDVLLLAALIGGGIYLLLRSGQGAHGSLAGATLTTLIAVIGVLLFSAAAILSLWVPRPIHLAQLACWSVLATTGVAVAWGRQFDAAPGVSGLGQASVTLSLAGLVAILAVEPRLIADAPVDSKPPLKARPWLLSVSLSGACVWLGAALLQVAPDSDRVGSIAQIVGVAALVALRTLGNQLTTAGATSRLAAALDDREEALASLHDAAAEIARSEARLRLLLDAAVDGVVELGPDDVVLRANDAFCAMIGLRAEDVIGRHWADVASAARAEVAFGALREGGQAVLTTETRSLHLEARVSSLPAEPPGTLLLVRDVTSSKVAEQTIRTLFQFLQDRDEDRTRYLRRSSVAIEAERNRIARDLHDGPIQGVAGASLSLEAVKLMIDSGRHDDAAEMLSKIRRELAEETENLRRLMSDLRPPLLEERGLLPAVRDLCVKFQEHTGIKVSVRAAVDGLVPSEIETIAYRVIQEALSNVAKHADASNVTVRIESGRGALEAEVEDDGCGFDASSLREYLRRGKVGLASMRERTELGSGTFTVRSRQRGGTTVTAVLPIELITAIRS
jgi:PAS domain S-box-containing protein